MLVCLAELGCLWVKTSLDVGAERSAAAGQVPRKTQTLKPPHWLDVDLLSGKYDRMIESSLGVVTSYCVLQINGRLQFVHRELLSGLNNKMMRLSRMSGVCANPQPEQVPHPGSLLCKTSS